MTQVKQQFTEAAVRKLKLPDGASDFAFYDTKMPGFGVRFREGGNVGTYFLRYKIGSKYRRVQLGPAAPNMLAHAKAEAVQLRATIARKVDPANERAKSVVAAGLTFHPAYVPFLEKMERECSASYHDATARYLDEHCKRLHGKSLAGIDHAMVARELTAITKERGPYAANRAGAALSAFFNWAIREGLRADRVNPADDTNKNKERKRDRTLTERELKIIWNGVPENEFGDIVKLLMLTMQRRDEIGGLPTAEFNREKRQLEIDGSRFKNTKDNTIPLSDVAFDIVARNYDADRKCIFGKIDTGFSGWSKAKAELDETLRGINVPWVFHDFRRTGKTIMSEELDVAWEVSEAILNHTKKGLDAVYNTAKYIRRKREALDAYSNWLMKIVNG